MFDNFQILGSTYLWPVTFGLGMFPSIMYLIASIKIPESPYYYVRAGMNEEATKLLRQLRTGNEVSKPILFSFDFSAK